MVDGEQVWNVEATRQYLLAVIAANDQRYQEHFTANDRRYQERFDSQAEATRKAEAASEHRFDGVNEFRGQLRDQAATFIPRLEYDTRQAALAEIVRASLASLDERLTGLLSRLDRIEGKSTGLNAGWGYLIGGVGLLATTISLLTFFAALKP